MYYSRGWGGREKITFPETDEALLLQSSSSSPDKARGTEASQEKGARLFHGNGVGLEVDAWMEMQMHTGLAARITSAADRQSREVLA